MLTYDKAKDITLVALAQLYLKNNPDWLWDPFPFENGDTDTEALRQANIAVKDNVSNDTPSNMELPYVTLLASSYSYYTEIIYETDSSRPTSSAIQDSFTSVNVISTSYDSSKKIYVSELRIDKKGNVMAALTWDATGTRRYEMGVDHGVLYIPDDTGVYNSAYAWNGLTSVTESPDGAEATDLWADNIKYGSIRSAETFGGTIEAYTYPDEFAACDGSLELTAGVHIGQQTRQSFGFSYRTQIGNDTPTTKDDGYILHLVYGCTASPSEKQYETINDSPDAITFSWEFDTTPVTVTAIENAKATSLITIDSTKADKTKLAALEKILYGDADTEARLPLPDEVYTLMKAA